MKAVLYTRVSPSPKTRADVKRPIDEARSLSLESQILQCRAHAEHKGYEVIGEFTDPAISGKDRLEKRPGLIAALALAARREDVVLVVYSLSRLSRRQSLTWALLDDRGEYRLQVQSVTEPFDTSTSMGRAMLGMLAVWAQLEGDMISERTVDALQARRERGYTLGRAPLVTYRPEDVHTIQELYRTGGFGLRRLVKHLNERTTITAPNGGPWHLSTLRRVLLSRAPVKAPEPEEVMP